MALRVPKAEITTELGESMIRQLGAVPEPLEVLWNNPKLATANQEFSAKVAEWDAADPSLKTFAHMAVAAQVGCSWCLDVNYFQALNQNLNLAKASQVPRWRESEVFTQVEREVLEYAEAMTNTPPTVTDERDRSFAASSRGVAFREPQVAAAFGETGPSGPAGAELTHGSWQGHTVIDVFARRSSQCHPLCAQGTRAGKARLNVRPADGGSEYRSIRTEPAHHELRRNYEQPVTGDGLRPTRHLLVPKGPSSTDVTFGDAGRAETHQCGRRTHSMGPGALCARAGRCA